MNENFVSYEDMETLLSGISEHNVSGKFIVFSEPNVSLYEGGSTIVYVRTNVEGTLTATSSAPALVTAQVGANEDGKYIEIENTSGTGDAVINVSVGDAKAKINVTVNALVIYGAEWNGSSSSPAWTRTDSAVGFSDPNPYYSGMSTTPSSPFDNISPWKDMTIVEDAEAGTLVSIPKYYYKWTRNGAAMKLQISMNQFEGSFVSPAHADRGDGKGERDVVYIGRYHCSSSNYKSATGVTPKVSITRATARSSIAALGSTIWQMDFAMWWTINMLYLVEFANWNSQEKIGYGCGNNSSTEKMGYTDSMTYHTGTTKSNRTTYGVGTQYRHIEGLWDNVCDWVDGIYFITSSIYCIKNPSSFSDTTGGTSVRTRAASNGWTNGWTTPSAEGFEYALYPNSVGSLTGSTYICDYCQYMYNYATGVTLYAGGYYYQSQSHGAFCLYGDKNVSYTGDYIGCRLMKLPN